MRVLHVTPYFAPAFRYGGPPRSILGLCQGLQTAGIEVEVLTTTADGPTPLPASNGELNDYQGVPVYYAPSAFPRRFFGARLAAPLADALERADLCHVHGIWNVPEWRATRAARKRRRPYVLSPRGMLQNGSLSHHARRKRLAFDLLESPALAHAALLHATSEDEARGLARLGFRTPVVTIPNGVDVDAAVARRAGSGRARLGIARQAFVVLFLGRVHPIKRLDLLADAFRSLRHVHPRAHLVIAGPDETGHRASIVERLGTDRAAVTVLDTVLDDEKWMLLADADVSVQCSDSESFGMATLESLAAGTPVVVTRTCPWPELEQAGAGFWVEQSADAIATALTHLAADPARVAATGERAAAFARERFSWAVIGRQMAQHYRTILDA